MPLSHKLSPYGIALKISTSRTWLIDLIEGLCIFVFTYLKISVIFEVNKLV